MASGTMKQASVSSTVQGGGKRREGMTRAWHDQDKRTRIIRHSNPCMEAATSES